MVAAPRRQGGTAQHSAACTTPFPPSPCCVSPTHTLQEDADLFSINYLHFGAPKVWYCVSPSNRAKFERMCQVRDALVPDSC
jgi:hypothetical protein